MSELKRKIVAEFSARNKAAGQTAAFRRDLDNVNRSLGRVAKTALTMAGIGGGIYALERGLRGAVRAAAEQEKSERALKAAIGSNISQYKSYAAEIQRQTIYGDELILSQMAYAANLGVTSDKLNEATKAAVGLAARFRIDLASAMMLVGRASQGQTQLLTRYGIVIDQSLSDQDKFNRLLKIGADSFHLAQEEARDPTGAYQQFQNALSDIAETIGGPLLKGLTDMAREVVNNKEEWQDFFRVQTAGWAEVLSGFESLGEITKPGAGMPRMNQNRGFSYGMPGFQPGAPGGLPQGELRISPKGMQRIAEMRAFQRRQEALGKLTADFMSAEFTATQSAAPAAPVSAARKRMQAIQDQVDMEIKMLGRLDEPRQHARLAIEHQALAMEEYGKNTKQAAEAVALLEAKLAELERRERLVKVAQAIGDAFGNAFEQMIFGAEKFSDVMKAMLRDIAAAVVRYQITQPMALAITEGMRAPLGRLFGVYHRGGIAGQPTEAKLGLASDFVGAPRFHGGSDNIPVFLKRNEHVLTPAQMNTLVGAAAGGMSTSPGVSVNVIVNNNSDVKLRQQGQPRWDGNKLVVNLVSTINDQIQRGEGPLRNTIINLGNNRL